MAVNLISSNDISITQTGSDIKLDFTTNAVANKNIYSTTETRIGTWIDGKPLYRKVISYDNPGTSLNVNHNISNVGYFKLEGNFTQNTISAPPFYASSTDFFRVFRNDTVLSARYGTGNNPTNITFIMEYTKTTD